jgi:hypothetical protein
MKRFAFILSACSTGKFSVKQCKQITDTKTECFTFEVDGESDFIPF